MPRIICLCFSQISSSVLFIKLYFSVSRQRQLASSCLHSLRPPSHNQGSQGLMFLLVYCFAFRDLVAQFRVLSIFLCQVKFPVVVFRWITNHAKYRTFGNFLEWWPITSLHTMSATFTVGMSTTKHSSNKQPSKRSKFAALLYRITPTSPLLCTSFWSDICERRVPGEGWYWVSAVLGGAWYQISGAW